MLTDFGLSRENVRKSEFGAKSFCGSYAYLAPEMLKKQGHGKAVDWYLLGVILYEMVTGLPPYYADDKEELFSNIIKNDLDLRTTGKQLNLSNECIDILHKVSKLIKANTSSYWRKILGKDLELKVVQLSSKPTLFSKAPIGVR